MLHFLSMTIENFGPYKGKQTIDFTDQEGVTIFWGDNGRGKTTLLNAFRYALFGVIQRRNGVLKSLREMENTEGRSEGHYGFLISLKMKSDDAMYELTRQYRPRKGVTEPTYDEDYEKLLFVKKDGAILSKERGEHELKVIMPQQVSRFFLFDGELLQEYEELLENTTQTADRIKQAIEQILGVPVLTNGVADIEECRYEYEKQKAKALQKDNKTQQYGLQIDQLNAQMAEHRLQIDILKTELSTLYKSKMTLQSKSDETEQVRAWIASRDALKKQLDSKEAELNRINERIKSLTKNAWKGMLSERILGVINEIKSEISTLERKKQNKAVADKFLEEIKRAVKDHQCPVCEQSVPETYLRVLQERINRSESQYSGLSDEEAERLLHLQGRLSNLSRLSVDSQKAEMKLYEDARLNLRIDIGTLNQQITEIKANIARYGDTSEVTSIATQLAQVLSKIDITEHGIKSEEEKLDSLQKDKDRIIALADKQVLGGDLLSASTRLERCEAILDIFIKGKDEYRRKLKQNVEKDATDLFVKLSSDKDYTGLQIHDNYGLSIVHSSGRLVPGRSSGFEHIVALSLIGALHKNAPLRGPIIMDSPFGRLDPTHKKNIVKYLPDMAEQSMLLAYTDEINAHVAHEALAGHLLKEYHLSRVNSMFTRIE